jgi:type IV pilus assembly protein PilZ
MESQKFNCSFTHELALYSAYMPFVKGGGLFIRTHHRQPIGALVNLWIQLMAEEQLYEVAAKVIWITPKGAQDNRASGMGVQFVSDNGRYLCSKIESYLAEMIKSSQSTDTM